MTSAGLDSNLTSSARMLGVRQPRPLSTLHVGGDITADGPIKAAGGLFVTGTLSADKLLVAAGASNSPNALIALTPRIGPQICVYDGGGGNCYGVGIASNELVLMTAGTMVRVRQSTVSGSILATIDAQGLSTYYLTSSDGSNGVVRSGAGSMYVRGANGSVYVDGTGGLNVTGGTLTVSGSITTGAINSADWFRLSAANVGIYNNITGTGIQFTGAGQQMYGGATHGDQIVGLATAQSLSNKTMLNMKVAGASAFGGNVGNDLTNYAFSYGTGVFTLPVPSAAYAGVFRAVRAWGADVTINCSTATLIPPGQYGTVTSSFVLRNGDSLTIWCDGANWWIL